MAETSTRTSTKAKASVPVTQGLDVQGELANLFAGLSAPAADITEPATLPPLPEAPGEMELSQGVKIGRAATVLAASLSGNPELAPLLMRQYHDQDARAQASAQQRFANSFALAESRRAEVTKAEETRDERKRAAVAEKFDTANTKLRALEAALRQVEIELSHTTDQGRREDLGAELRVLQEAVESAKQQQGIGDPKALEKNLGIAEITQQAIARGLLKEGEELTPENFPVIRGRVLEQMIEESKTIRPKENLELRNIYNNTTSPLVRALYPQLIEALPDPATLDPGDPRVVAETANAMLRADPDAHEKQVEALAHKWISEGRYSDLAEAEQHATEWTMSEGRADIDIPPPGTHRTGPSMLEQLGKFGGALGEKLGIGPSGKPSEPDPREDQRIRRRAERKYERAKKARTNERR